MNTQRKIATLRTVFFLLALPAATSVNSAGATITDLMRGMATGLALMGQAGGPVATPYPGMGSPFFPMAPGYGWPGAQTFPGWGSTPWQTMTPYAGTTHPGNTPRSTESSRVLERLQGSWKTENGGLLLVRRDMARLYIDRDQYQDFYLNADNRYLWLWPINSQASQRYEYHFSTDRVILRDEFGSSLSLFKYQLESPSRQPGRNPLR